MNIKDIIEGITIGNDSILKFNFNDPESFSTKFGKLKLQPLIKTSELPKGQVIYSVYSIKKTNVSTQILKALKQTSTEVKINDDDYKYFIKRTAIYICGKILKPNSIDVIITPKSSSNILNDLLNDITRILPHIKIYPSSFVKNIDLSKITINVDHPKITPSIINSLQRLLNKSIKTGQFELKKVKTEYRKFFQNIFDVVDEDLFLKLEDKNICILDDILTSGTTLSELLSKVTKYNPSTISGLTIFKMN